MKRRRKWLDLGRTRPRNLKKRKVKKLWRLNGKRVDEVNEFFYPGYWFQYNGRQDLNVRRRIEREI